MSRRHDIEGQLSLFDLPIANVEAQEEKKKSAAKKATLAGKFPECSNCWCYTCEHSTVGGGAPRAFMDGERPCPSCEFFVNDGIADVCVIGSAKEGCSFRAAKEGLQ